MRREKELEEKKNAKKGVIQEAAAVVAVAQKNANRNSVEDYDSDEEEKVPV